MIGDAGLDQIITSKAGSEQLPSCDTALTLIDAEVICDEGDDRNPEVFTGPDHLAYVIYTSGSTGRPKGTAIPHRAVVRLVRDTNFVTIHPGDRVAQVANAVFDAATFGIWAPLLNGGVIIGMSRDEVLSTPRFAARLAEYPIRAFFLTSSLFNRHVREQPDMFHSVDTLLVGGEALDPRSIATVLEQGPPKRLLNGYGPTEKHDVQYLRAD